MSRLAILHLYRPQLPGPRAQAIQVLHTCHALAQAGVDVTLLADPAPGAPAVSPARALAWYGLEPLPGLTLEISAVRHPGLRGLAFRRRALAWAREPGPRVVLARSKGYLRELLRWPGHPPAALESHELDSALDREAGRSPARSLALERAVLAGAGALICNAEGTLAAWEEAHGPDLPARRAVVRNATAPGRLVPLAPGDPPTLGYLGSPGAFKGMGTLLRAAKALPSGARLEVLGGAAGALDGFGPRPASVLHTPALPYDEVPARLARWRAAVVALDDNLFGRAFCDPLKLWDYLAVGLPLALPDLPNLRARVPPDRACWYRPGDVESLAGAMAEALVRPPSPPRLRSWADRAAELLPLLEGLAAGAGG